MNKALNLLKTNKTVSERASNYVVSIQRNIQRDVIDQLIARKEKIEQDLFDLADFTLDTNLNAGQKRMTKEDCEERFKRIIDLEYQLTIVGYELEIKQKSFNKYFGEEVTTQSA